jgi:hypothetical protein
VRFFDEMEKPSFTFLPHKFIAAPPKQLLFVVFETMRAALLTLLSVVAMSGYRQASARAYSTNSSNAATTGTSATERTASDAGSWNRCRSHALLPLL